ncbi:MATE family multidrug exporter [Klebsiella pneumoniae]|uniref:MATE family multidrug exporter n=1 Tax=Klebsiella pneumoniae TaxID=573 RepID=A0A377XH06_KLEPN|nr:MATE family multidrug exporter [Klebsiella pneumoniae]
MNVTSAVRQAVERTSWFKKRQRYRVLYWREISPLAVPILLENACVLLMGVLSTFLVSWLGKEAMAGVGLADSFNMVIMSFFAAIDLGTRWWWPLASASAIGGGRGRPRASRWPL